MQRTEPQQPLAAAVAALAVASIVVAASAPFALFAPPQGRSWQASCPSGYAPLPERAAQIATLLRSTERGQRLLSGRAAGLPLCFKPAAESGFAGALVFLDEQVGDRENAARLGHLLLHRTQAAMTRASAAPGMDCAVRLEELVAAEARAHALELELRRELGVSEPQRPFAFEDAFWAAPAAERTEVVRSFLLAHPNGAPGVPALVGAYRRRCAAGARLQEPAMPSDGTSQGPQRAPGSSGPAEQTP